MVMFRPVPEQIHRNCFETVVELVTTETGMILTQSRVDYHYFLEKITSAYSLNQK